MMDYNREKEQYTPQLSDDRLYRALASRRRRRLLYFLLEEQECTAEEIATVLTGWEATETGTVGDVDDRERIALTLAHVHLPLLAETGLVEYNRKRDTVRLGSIPDAVCDLVRRSVESTPPSDA